MSKDNSGTQPPAGKQTAQIEPSRAAFRLKLIRHFSASWAVIAIAAAAKLGIGVLQEKPNVSLFSAVCLFLTGLQSLTLYLFTRMHGNAISLLEMQNRTLAKTSGLIKETNQLAKIGGWELDPQTQELWWSDETYRLHDLPVSSAISLEEAISFYAPEGRSELEEAVRKGMECGTGWNLKLPLLTARGRRIWVQAIGRSQTRPDGSVTLQGTFQDITDHHEFMHALETAHDQALRAAESQGHYLAFLSHSFQRPLLSVLANLEKLEGVLTTGGNRVDLEELRRDTARLVHVADDLTDLSSLASKRVKLNNSPFRLSEVLASVQSTFQPLATSRQLEFTVSAEPDAPETCCGDAIRILQVLFHLVSNAIKYTDSGFVRVRAQGKVGESVSLHFSVADSGRGIPQEMQKQLFKPQLMLPPMGESSQKETGFGLAVSSKLVEALGGHITFESTPGEGSIFRFSVRLSHPPQTLGDQTLPTSDANTLVGRRILVVDDNPVNLRVANTLLLRLGCVPTACSSGLEALELHKSTSFDAVLMDIFMPEMDGLETTERLLAVQPDLAIIALTANALPQARQEYLARGMREVVTKPYTREALTRALLAHVPNANQRTSSASEVHERRAG